MLRALEVGVLLDRFDHEGADVEVLGEVGDEPAVGDDFGLLEEELAAGVDFGEDEAHGDGLEDVAFHAGEEVSAGGRSRRGRGGR